MTRSKPKVQELWSKYPALRLIDSRTARQFSFRIHPIPLFQASVETQTRQRVLIPLCMQMLSFAKKTSMIIQKEVLHHPIWCRCGNHTSL